MSDPVLKAWGSSGDLGCLIYYLPVWELDGITVGKVILGEDGKERPVKFTQSGPFLYSSEIIEKGTAIRIEADGSDHTVVTRFRPHQEWLPDAMKGDPRRPKKGSPFSLEERLARSRKSRGR